MIAKNKNLKTEKGTGQIVKCMVPGCVRPASAPRGLCNACYFTAVRMVRAGLTSWGALEQNGLAMTAKKGPCCTNPLRAAVQKIGKDAADA